MRNLILIFLFLILNSCVGDGTDTGNPGLTCIEGGSCTVASIGDENQSRVIALESVFYNMCLVVNECKNQSTLSCRSALRTQSNIDVEVGLEENEFEDAQAIIDAEYDELLAHDSDVLSACIDDLDRLTCRDEVVENAYNPAKANPYEQAVEMIPTSCRTLF